MRQLYSVTWWLALPIVLMRLYWRGRKEPGYRIHVAERLGFYPQGFSSRGAVVWIHAVSVGETRASEPVVEALLAQSPDQTVLLTHMTPTGRAAGRDLFGRYGTRVVQSYVPYDIGWMLARFLMHFSPRICILMETEVWPNMIAQCVKHGVPVMLANARLSERSYRKAQRLPGLFFEAAAGISLAAAQTEGDAARLKSMGVPRVEVVGSVKFDVMPQPLMLEQGARLREQLGTRKVLLCASTREGEEELILQTMGRHLTQDMLVIIVPRHPQRFADVARLIEEKGLRICRRSGLGDAKVPAEIDVVLGDTMGEMFAYYAACDVAFIGGSLLPLGGQNLIEACAVGKPVLTGPHTFNFAAATEHAIRAGAAIRVADAEALFTEGHRLLQDEAMRDQMGSNARMYAERHRGATQRTTALVRELLAERGSDS